MIVCDICVKPAIYYSVIARLSDKNFQQKDYCEECYNKVQGFIEDCKHNIKVPEVAPKAQKRESLKLKPQKVLLK